MKDLTRQAGQFDYEGGPGTGPSTTDAPLAAPTEQVPEAGGPADEPNATGEPARGPGMFDAVDEPEPTEKRKGWRFGKGDRR